MSSTRIGFSSWGMVATEAADERQARVELARGDFEFVIVNDRVLTAHAELTAMLTAAVAFGDFHLVVLTAATDHANGLRLPDAGTHLLPKPVGVRRLQDCLYRLCMPSAEPRREAGAVNRPGAAGGDRVRILLAEDNEINQLVAEDLLELLGFDCDLARNGAEALSLAAAHTYRAILMDCQMPHMDGYAATAALREREAPGRRVPIIAMTAGALAEDRDQCFAAGIDDYLAKPIDVEALRAALERWTGGTPHRAR